jgi:hypothetical protein
VRLPMISDSCAQGEFEDQRQPQIDSASNTD